MTPDERVVVPLDHHARERSPSRNSAARRGRARRSRARRPRPRVRSTGWAWRSGLALTRTLISTCGNGTMPSSDRLEGPLVEHRIEEQERRSAAVAGGRLVRERSRAPIARRRGRVFRDHPLEDVLVADRARGQRIPCRQPLLEPEVAHDRRDHASAGEAAVPLQVPRAAGTGCGRRRRRALARSTARQRSASPSNAIPRS